MISLRNSRGKVAYMLDFSRAITLTFGIILLNKV